MIIIDNMALPNLEAIMEFIKILDDNSYKKEHEDIIEMYQAFLIECFEADQRLQQMVFDRLGEEYISFSIIPINDTEDLNSFSFQLAIEDSLEIKKRDELIYQDLCDICFGGIEPFYTRLSNYYIQP